MKVRTRDNMKLDMNTIIEQYFLKFIFLIIFSIWLIIPSLIYNIPLYYILYIFPIIILREYLNFNKHLVLREWWVNDVRNFDSYLNDNYLHHKKYKLGNIERDNYLKKKLYDFFYYHDAYYLLWKYILSWVIILILGWVFSWKIYIFLLSFCIFLWFCILGTMKFIEFRKKKIKEIDNKKNIYIVLEERLEIMSFKGYDNNNGWKTYIFY